jgi:hypothetical protein
MHDPLVQADELALDILKRLESDERLSTVALSALRLADTQGDVVHRTWIAAEIAGELYKAPGRKWTSDEREGLEMFFRTRSAHLATSLDEEEAYIKAGKIPPRGEKGLFAHLEALENLKEPDPPTPRTDLNHWMQAVSAFSESRRILVLIRRDLHTWVSATRLRVHSARIRTELLGPDAPAVFAAGGSLLDELSKAVESLGRPGLHATAAMQARTALMTLGRELCDFDGEHESPITGKKFLLNTEKRKVRAVLDNLWTRSPGRRALIEKANAAVEEAYVLGSKAKDPFAITHDEATTAVKDVYAVAHAICFAGGFSPSQA